MRLKPSTRDALARAAEADARSVSAYAEMVLERHLRAAGFLTRKPDISERPARSMRIVFGLHKGSAKQRGIPFLFEFETWSEWWREDNRWERRWKEGLCMARRGDDGPYSPDNVYCTTAAQNTTDYFEFKRRKGAPLAHNTADRFGFRQRKEVALAQAPTPANPGRAGRPPLNVKSTHVRLAPDARTRILALVGKSGMAGFIRDAVDAELLRREAERDAALQNQRIAAKEPRRGD